jgi:hypothetical protein
MRKLLFFVVFFLLTSSNSALVSVALCDSNDEAIEMPINDSEETSEEDDDEVDLTHRWISRDKSTNSSLHFLYQEVVFQSLELEVVVPPPKA